jgi:hypothetical protein
VSRANHDEGNQRHHSVQHEWVLWKTRYLSPFVGKAN